MSLTLALLLALSAPASWAEVPMRVVLQTTSGRDDALVRRVRAQLSDLPVALVAAPIELAPTLGAQLAQAERRARAEGARVVVWLVPPRRGQATRIYVLVTRPAPGRLVERAIETDASAPVGETSATELEIAAIITRSTLQEVLAGAVVGISREAVPADVERVAVRAPEPPPPREPVRSFAALGWQPSWPGPGRWSAPGLTAEAGLVLGAFRVGAAAAATMPERLADELAEIELGRYRGALLARARLLSTRWLSLHTGAQLGLMAFRRTTVSGAVGTMPTPGRTTFTPLVSPEVTARVHLTRRWGLVGAAAADVVPGRPSVAYDLAGQVKTVWALWLVQPRLQVMLDVEF